uniref:Uncharacterized protein n=1 Tax=Plectus sambesii TaxID=2011161 RepID=A0A914V273_9BILA
MLMAIYHACHLLHSSERQIYSFPTYGNFIAVEESTCLTGEFCQRNSIICKVGQWPPKSRRQVVGFDDDSAIMLTDVNDLPEWVQTKIGRTNLHILESPIELQ